MSRDHVESQVQKWRTFFFLPKSFERGLNHWIWTCSVRLRIVAGNLPKRSWNMNWMNELNCNNWIEWKPWPLFVWGFALYRPPAKGIGNVCWFDAVWLNVMACVWSRLLSFSGEVSTHWFLSHTHLTHLTKCQYLTKSSINESSKWAATQELASIAATCTTLAHRLESCTSGRILVYSITSASLTSRKWVSLSSPSSHQLYEHFATQHPWMLQVLIVTVSHMDSIQQWNNRLCFGMLSLNCEPKPNQGFTRKAAATSVGAMNGTASSTLTTVKRPIQAGATASCLPPILPRRRKAIYTFLSSKPGIVTANQFHFDAKHTAFSSLIEREHSIDLGRRNSTDIRKSPSSR